MSIQPRSSMSGGKRQAAGGRRQAADGRRLAPMPVLDGSDSFLFCCLSRGVELRSGTGSRGVAPDMQVASRPPDRLTWRVIADLDSCWRGGGGAEEERRRRGSRRRLHVLTSTPMHTCVFPYMYIILSAFHAFHPSPICALSHAEPHIILALP